MGWKRRLGWLPATAAVAGWLAGAIDLSGQSASAPCGLEMRVLVVSADGREAALPAITRTLEYLGTPFTTYVATSTPGGLTAEFLSDGCHANYQAVILTTGDVRYLREGTWTIALTPAEAAALAAFEARFQVRQATWYSVPTPDLGFNYGRPYDTRTSPPLPIHLTSAGRTVFPYLTLTRPLLIRDAYGYLATALDGTTPLLTDDEGHAVAALRAYPDGRENLAFTFDSNENLVHAIVLGYGVINWVTRGIFIGERHIFASPQIDDLFIDNDRWSPSVPCGTDPETTGVNVRMTGDDFNAVAAWQRARNRAPATAGVRLTWPFSGVGTSGIYGGDTLTAAAKAGQGDFLWVNQTYRHDYLDAMSYAATLDDIRLNGEVAIAMGFSTYNMANLVTPHISGLRNPAVLQAAADAGVRFVVTDASKPGYDNPSPNAGIYSALVPSILMIPRRATNLFYNVTAPAEWVAEYNCLYRSYWNRDLSYDEILTVESDRLTMHLLRGENDPWMFHQPNAVAYDGRHTLLTDLLDRAFDSYAGYFNLPILSPPMDVLGQAMAARMKRLASEVRAILLPGRSITFTSNRPVTVPVTGLFVPGAEVYGGQPIAWIPVQAGTVVSVPLTPSADPPSPTLPNGWVHQDIGAVGVTGGSWYDNAVETFAIEGAGADVWGVADALHFTYRPLYGDGQIVAQVASVQNLAPWVKAGVMIRESLYSGSAQGFMLVSAARGLAFQRRTVTDGATTSTTGGADAAPVWVRLDRVGNTVSAYQSTDGLAWTLVGADTIPMGATAYIGLGVSSHNVAAVARATFTHVSVTSGRPTGPLPAPGPLPFAWLQTDIGVVGSPGRASYDTAASAFTVTGAGADSGGAADALHFAARTLTGDGQISARVASLGSWDIVGRRASHGAGAGVMIRASLDASAAQAFALVTPTKSVAFKRRPVAGAANVTTAGTTATGPYWVRLTRAGDTVIAYASADGTHWTAVGSETMQLPATIYVGLAVMSGTTIGGTTGTFDQVLIEADEDAEPAAVSPPASGSAGATPDPAEDATHSATRDRASAPGSVPAPPAAGATTDDAPIVKARRAESAAPPETPPLDTETAPVSAAPGAHDTTAMRTGPQAAGSSSAIVDRPAVRRDGAGDGSATAARPAEISATGAGAPRTDIVACGSPPCRLDGGERIWIPAPVTSWQWQLHGILDTTVSASMYDTDLFDTSAAAISALHAKGARVVCYLSAGTFESWRPDAARFPARAIGRGVNGWAGERWLDIRQLDALGPIIEARMNLCREKGFDAVEPDNVDGYVNHSGFPLTAEDQLRYNRWLAAAAHARGLSIGLKNDLHQVSDLVTAFDWAITEQCFQYKECDLLAPFTKAGKAVFAVEYDLPTSAFCGRAAELGLNGIRKRLALDAGLEPCPVTDRQHRAKRIRTSDTIRAR
jgi:regulation of enolase protein 1 (concanavalin A-like superfamily)